MKRLIQFLSIVFMVFMIIKMIVGLNNEDLQKTIENNDCAYLKKMMEVEISGTITDIYFDSLNHMALTHEYMNKGEVGRLYISGDVSGLKDFLRPKDSVSKLRGSLEFDVHRDSIRRQFVLKRRNNCD